MPVSALVPLRIVSLSRGRGACEGAGGRIEARYIQAEFMGVKGRV
ncbi:hypothetical protein O4H61_07185 [Roseovarius aestuarii]|nr:hypothetical protein [Roseovarius aestuarii]